MSALWIMIGIETSGPAYGRHSMTELGAAVGSRKLGLTDPIELVIQPLSEAPSSPARTRTSGLREGLPPAEAMRRFDDWSRPYREQRAQFVARPAALVDVYCAWTYLNANPFGFKAVCASSWFQPRRKAIQGRAAACRRNAMRRFSRSTS